MTARTLSKSTQSGNVVHKLPTIAEVRSIIGTASKGMSDESIKKLIAQVDILTDVVLVCTSGSKNHSSIDILNHKPHNLY